MSAALRESALAVRLAAHELANACAVLTGGTEMAIGLTFPPQCACEERDTWPNRKAPMWPPVEEV